MHHSASPRDATTLAKIRRWHRDRGWQDVGYNRVIEATGICLDGRPIQNQPAHAQGHNKKGVGVCVVGDNTTIGEDWNEAQILALIAELRFLRSQFPTARIAGHRDLKGAKTECPGLNLRTLLRNYDALDVLGEVSHAPLQPSEIRTSAQKSSWWRMFVR